MFDKASRKFRSINGLSATGITMRKRCRWASEQLEDAFEFPVKSPLNIEESVIIPVICCIFFNENKGLLVEMPCDYE